MQKQRRSNSRVRGGQAPLSWKEAQSEQRGKDSCRLPPESYDQEQAKDELRDGHSPSQETAWYIGRKWKAWKIIAGQEALRCEVAVGVEIAFVNAFGLGKQPNFVTRRGFSWERGMFSGALFRGNWRVNYGVI